MLRIFNSYTKQATVPCYIIIVVIAIPVLAALLAGLMLLLLDLFVDGAYDCRRHYSDVIEAASCC